MLEKLKSYCKEKKIYCYGAGYYGRVVCTFLTENDLDVKAFLVTKKTATHDSFFHIPVYALDEVSLHDDDCVLVAASTQYASEMTEELNRRGMLSYRVISEELLHSLENHIEFRNGLCNDNRINVLFYHRVNKLTLDVWNLAITPRRFEEHVLFLKNNYRILPFDGEWHRTEKRSVVITFDDGYADFYEYAFPILEKHQVPATVFISTGNIDTDREFWWDELENIVYHGKVKHGKTIYRGINLSAANDDEKKYLCHTIRLILKGMCHTKRKDELEYLRELFQAKHIMPRKTHRTLNMKEILTLSKSPYVTIGAHTVTHTSLSTETPTEQERELAVSKSKLESIINRKVTSFAYPFGEDVDYTDVTKNIAMAIGYERIATTGGGLNTGDAGLFSIKRNGVPNCSISELKKLVGLSFLRYG